MPTPAADADAVEAKLRSIFDEVVADYRSQGGVSLVGAEIFRWPAGAGTFNFELIATFVDGALIPNDAWKLLHSGLRDRVAERLGLSVTVNLQAHAAFVREKAIDGAAIALQRTISVFVRLSIASTGACPWILLEYPDDVSFPSVEEQARMLEELRRDAVRRGLSEADAARLTIAFRSPQTDESFMTDEELRSLHFFGG